MPIKNRIDMLSTGIRTPIGVKVTGSDIKTIQAISEEVESAVKTIRGTRNVYAERNADGYYLDFDLKRDRLSRYGISIADAQAVVNSAVGGENITYTIEGRERYPVAVRYARQFRENIEALKRVLVSSPTGAQIPMAELADIRMVQGPAMLRNENGLLASYVYIDVTGRDIGGYVSEARKVVASKVTLPPGYNLFWSGQYENMNRVKERLKVVVPLTIFLIALLLYLNTKSAIETGIVLLAVPFSAVGGIWLLYLLGYNLSVAVWVGLIALMGLDAETGVFMLLYLTMAYKEKREAGQLTTKEDLDEAIIHGAVKRIRPKMMTVLAAFMGLLPIMWSTGAGGDVMRRIAAPMIGGLVTSFALELLVYPVIFHLWKAHSPAMNLAGLERPMDRP
jgi:Cu(I)/Ag(I) efflux system membrane protein CusA/SilA